jgi:hypothetical protein
MSKKGLPNVVSQYQPPRIEVDKLQPNPKRNIESVFKSYKQIEEVHCKSLIYYLYSYVNTWANPITGASLQKDNSPIIVVFLSVCYYNILKWSNFNVDDVIKISGHEKTWKEHILTFIDERYLYDPANQKPVAGAPGAPGAKVGKVTGAPAGSPAGAKVGKVTGAPAGAKVGKVTGAPGAPASPMGAKVGKIASPPGVVSPPKVASPPGIRFAISPKSRQNTAKNAKKLSHKTDLMTEEKCIELLDDIKAKMVGKTADELKTLKVKNPLTTGSIELKSPILQNYLVKCYFHFDKKELKASINKVVDVEHLEKIKELIDGYDVAGSKAPATLKADDKPTDDKQNKGAKVQVERRERMDKERDEVIEPFIEGLVDEFYKCCDELESNCDSNGVLSEYKYIANVVKAIVTIIFTKYLHLPHYIEKLYDNYKLPLKIYIMLYDDPAEKYYTQGVTKVNAITHKMEEIASGGGETVIYQKNNLGQMVEQRLLNQITPNTVATHYENTMLNRQYLFEIYRTDSIRKGTFNQLTLMYNKINDDLRYFSNSFNLESFPKTLEYAKKIIGYNHFKYNITNSVLPRYIHVRTTDTQIGIHQPFKDLVEKISARLATLPNITGIASEATVKKAEYDGVITKMKENSYADNGTGYGDTDMIRKNLLYSLNAQNPRYILKDMKKYPSNIYYNYGFTGTFPIFTWIPLNKDLAGDKYNFPSIATWQPFGTAYTTQFMVLGEAYKNYGNSPWSKTLNETVFKVITGAFESVKSLQDPNEIERMTRRVNETLGVYKDMSIEVPADKKKAIYLYHGTKNKIHTINDSENDIEMLGFLSTTLNVHTASYYSDVGISGSGFIYIIEVDETHSYINLNDNLYQFILLPHSIIRIVCEFNFGDVKVVLCRLIRTPTIEENEELYDKLLGTAVKAPVPTIHYKIKANTMSPFICGKMDDTEWKAEPIYLHKFLQIYEVFCSHLNNEKLKRRFSKDTAFIYFSLGQENELYVSRGLPLEFGGFADIKYTLHQHFIKDCYKEVGIPCIDYFFIHGSGNNTIATGILADEYENNRSEVFKYDVNNFLIDCIFKFDRIDNAKKTLSLHIETGDKNIYADKIENFRDAGLYMNGVIDPFFRGTYVGEHIQFLLKYMRTYKKVFSKYSEASDAELDLHFEWCNSRIVTLIDTIEEYKTHYIEFIQENIEALSSDTNDPNDPKGTAKVAELLNMIEELADTLRQRAVFYFKVTNGTAIEGFRNILRTALREPHQSVHYSKLYENADLKGLMFPSKKGGFRTILEDRDRGAVIESFTKKGLLKTANASASPRANARASATSASSTRKEPVFDKKYHEKMYEAYKNVPIQEYRDMRKFKDMPLNIQEYYGEAVNNKKYIDISGHCYVRLVSRRNVNRMIEKDKNGSIGGKTKSIRKATKGIKSRKTK